MRLEKGRKAPNAPFQKAVCTIRCFQCFGKNEKASIKGAFFQESTQDYYRAAW